MRIRGSSLVLRGASLFFIVLAVILTIFQLVRYSLLRANYPSDMKIRGGQHAVSVQLKTDQVRGEVNDRVAVMKLDRSGIDLQDP